MHLLIYDNQYEPFTAVLLKNKEKINLKTLWVKDLIDKAEIFDEFDQNSTKLCWTLPQLGKITNDKSTHVINRVFHIPDEWFKQFNIKDREYAKNEFWAYLTFALNAFQKVTERPNFGGLCGGCYSLPFQWDMIQRHIPQVKTPEYFIGPLQYIPEEWDQNTIFSHPYNFYFWKKNSYEEKEKSSLFAIRKPEGTPILAFVLEDECVLFHETKISKQITKNIEKIALEISAIFKYFTSEILFFLHDDSLTFAMIHNSPIGSSQSPTFEEKSLQYVLKKQQGNVCT